MDLFNKIKTINLNDVKNIQIKTFNLNEFKNMHDAISLNHYTCSFIKSYLKNLTYTSKFIKNISIQFTNEDFDYNLKELLNTDKEASGGYFGLYTENGNSICVGFKIPKIGNSNYNEYLVNIINAINETIYFVSVDFNVDEQFNQTMSFPQ